MQIKAPPSSAQCPQCRSTNTKAYLDVDHENQLLGIRCSQCGTVFHLDEHIVPNMIQEWIYTKTYSGQMSPDTTDLLAETGDTPEKLAGKIAKIMLAATQIGVDFGQLILLALIVTEDPEL